MDDIRQAIKNEIIRYREKYKKRKHGNHMAYPPGGVDVVRLCNFVAQLLNLPEDRKTRADLESMLIELAIRDHIGGWTGWRWDASGLRMTAGSTATPTEAVWIALDAMERKGR
ncbi:MAG: hypothetical protein ABIK92_21685 [Pseudomonadota bacterium]